MLFSVTVESDSISDMDLTTHLNKLASEGKTGGGETGGNSLLIAANAGKQRLYGALECFNLGTHACNYAKFQQQHNTKQHVPFWTLLRTLLRTSGQRCQLRRFSPPTL